MNKKVLYLGSFFVSIAFFVTLGLMVLNQNGWTNLEKRSHFTKKAKTNASTISRRIDTFLAQVSIYTNSVALAEIFTAKTLNLNNFPEDLRSQIKRIRITDSKGQVLFSTAGTLDQGVFLSQQVLALAGNSFTVFASSREVFAAITRYDSPLSLQPSQKGYILFEFRTSSILEGLKDVDISVRVENGSPLLVLKDNPSITYQQVSSFNNIAKLQKGGLLTGLVLNVPNLGNVVYYMGNNFYFPPMLSSFSLFFFLIAAISLYMYTKERNTADYQAASSDEVKTLVKDINEGRSFSKTQSFEAMDLGTKFGTFPDDIDTELDSLLKQDDGEAVTESSLELSSVVGDNNKSPFSFEPLEDTEQDFPVEFSGEDTNIFDSVKDTDDIFGINSDENLKNTESDEAMLLNDDSDFEQDFNSEPSITAILPQQAFIQHLSELREGYGITHEALAENRGGVFSFDQDNVFGKTFQITEDDPIFQELLSKGKALSLSGGLNESDYIKHLIDSELLASLGDLFIMPILDNDEKVVSIAVLARDASLTPLSVEEKQVLFSYE